MGRGLGEAVEIDFDIQRHGFGILLDEPVRRPLPEGLSSLRLVWNDDNTPSITTAKNPDGMEFIVGDFSIVGGLHANESCRLVMPIDQNYGRFLQLVQVLTTSWPDVTYPGSKPVELLMELLSRGLYRAELYTSTEFSERRPRKPELLIENFFAG